MVAGPQSSFVERDDLHVMLDAVADGDLDEAVRIVRGLLDRGVTHDDLIVDLFVEVQARSGACWQRNEWSVAQEHAATGVIESLLGLMAIRSDTTGWRGRVAVACVEDEWHTMPVRLLNERLRLRGWGTVFLGQSMPADHLTSYLTAGGFSAVVLSCQIAGNLEGAVRSVAAGHRAGLPVVIGGRGLGPDGQRAQVIGADAWAHTIEELDEVLEAWVHVPPAALATDDIDGEQRLLVATSADIVQQVMTDLPEHLPEMAAYGDAEHLHARQDIAHLVRFLGASVLCRDPRILADFLIWMEVVLAARGVSPRVLEAALDVLPDAISSELRATHRVVNEVLQAR